MSKQPFGEGDLSLCTQQKDMTLVWLSQLQALKHWGSMLEVTRQRYSVTCFDQDVKIRVFSGLAALLFNVNVRFSTVENKYASQRFVAASVLHGLLAPCLN